MTNLRETGADGARRPWLQPVGFAPAGGESELSQILSVIGRHRWFLVASASAGILVAAAFAATAPSIYTARARLMIESRSSPVTARDSPGGGTPLEIPEVESQVEYMRSEKLALAVARRLNITSASQLSVPSHPALRWVRERIAAGQADARAWLEAAGLASPHPKGGAGKPEQDQVAGTIRDGLEVYRVGAAYVIEIGYSLDNPALAAAVANAAAQVYVSNQVETRSQVWKVASDWMLQRLTELQQLASRASRDAQTFKAENAIIDAGRRGLVGEQQVEELNTALASARAKTVEARALRDQFRRLLTADIADPGMTDALRDSVVAGLRKQYVDLLQRVDELRRRLGPNHEAVVALTKDVGAVQRSLHAELERIASAADSDYQIAKAREDSTATAFNDLLSKSIVTSQARVRARELDRAAEAYETIYTNLLQRYIDAVNQQSYPQPSAQVITRAEVPDRPSAPRTGLLLLLGALLGAGLGISVVFGRQWFDRSVRTPAQLAERGIRCLAALPRPQVEPGFGKAYRQARRLGDPAARPGSVEAFAAGAARAMPHSAFAEGLHGIKSELFGSERRRPIRAVGITSFGSHDRTREDRTCLASNLALLLAHARQPGRGRPLLIDGDTGTAGLSRLHRLSDAPGLLDVLAERCELAEAVALGPAGLSILPTGHAPGADVHVSDLITEEGVASLLGSRGLAERVIVDLPPLQALVPARALLDQLDGVVVVAEWGVTDLEALSGALRAFAETGCDVLGVVIAGVARPADAVIGRGTPIRAAAPAPTLVAERGAA
ncbi:GumC family protein [Methylobacterium sp. A54F]